MFDKFSQALIDDIPDFEGLIKDDVARALSRAYLAILERRISNKSAKGQDRQSVLRRIANTLIFHAVLDPEKTPSERKAAAFVAAESLSLVSQYLELERESNPSEDEIDLNQHVCVEAALLYLFADFDACADGVARSLKSDISDSSSVIKLSSNWAFERLSQLCQLRSFPKLDTEFEYYTYPAKELNPIDLEEDTICRLYLEIGAIAQRFTKWLTTKEADFSEIESQLDLIIETLAPDSSETIHRTGGAYALIYHLATLMRLCFPSLGDRALLHHVPTPPRCDSVEYGSYLKKRARGNKRDPGRPVLWPSAYAYVKDCIIGENHHAVISMPTGSGKSFIAELAISQVLHAGWALYLAPTNALTEQIRSDLRRGLRPFKCEIMAFVGSQEYSILEGDSMQEMPDNSVAVMTPEKCALALRLSPEAFLNCRLVVFDECHLLGDTGSRGPLAELVMAQLLQRAPEARHLLMSAIVQNPEDLAQWLQESTGHTSSTIRIRWRPTRTLRAVLGIDFKTFLEEGRSAQATLTEMAEHRKTNGFTAKFRLVANVRGAWESEEKTDYKLLTLRCLAGLKVKRKKISGEWKYYWEPESWVNQSAITLATEFANSGIQTLVFTPSNKHYPFQNSSKVKLEDKVIEELEPSDYETEILRILAEFELGCTSEVFESLKRGIAIHTSLMIETEKAASERAFKKGKVPLMFATGTLAQGLNLPAIAVIIAGTKIGDTRHQNLAENKQRRFSQLLNAAGRAGRAGFSNQGLVIAITDKPELIKGKDSIPKVRDKVDYLQQSDDAVTIGSSLDGFLDKVCLNALSANGITDVELLATSLLAGGDENQLPPADVLKNTFAAYFRKKRNQSEPTNENAAKLIQLGEDFIKDTGATSGLTVAAQRAGLDFFLMLCIGRAWAKIRPSLPPDLGDWSVQQWTKELLSFLPEIPPGWLGSGFEANRLEKISPEFRAVAKNESLLGEKSLAFRAPPEWVKAWKTIEAPLCAWMSGEPISRIAEIITGEEHQTMNPARSSSNSIPKALAVAYGPIGSLSLIAGGFVAIAEQILGDVPLPLASLPLCIRNGCDSPQNLSWYRFGVRLRKPASLLNTRFPPPPDLSEEQLSEWVRQKKKDWLEGEEHEDEIGEVLKGYCDL